MCSSAETYRDRTSASVPRVTGWLLMASSVKTSMNVRMKPCVHTDARTSLEDTGACVWMGTDRPSEEIVWRSTNVCWISICVDPEAPATTSKEATDAHAHLLIWLPVTESIVWVRKTNYCKFGHYCVESGSSSKSPRLLKKCLFVLFSSQIFFLYLLLLTKHFHCSFFRHLGIYCG